MVIMINLISKYKIDFFFIYIYRGYNKYMINWIPMMNWTPGINWLYKPIVNNKNSNENKKIKKSNLLIISDMDDMINKLEICNLLNIFCSKTYNLHLIKTTKTYDYSIKIISNFINSTENDTFVIVSSISSIYLVDSILKYKTFNKIKKIIFLSPFILSLKNNIKYFQNINLDIIYGTEKNKISKKEIELISFQSEYHVLYSIKNNLNNLNNLEKNKLKTLILSLLR